jgi:hypothetical protein
MNPKRFPRFLFFLLAVSFVAFGCLSPAAGSAAFRSNSESAGASGSSPSAGTSIPLWYLTRGGPKLDQGWGVDVDREGNIYFATFQQAEQELFADMVIYKFAPDGSEIWQTRWGGKKMEKAFIVTVDEPYVYVGGLTYTSTVNLNEADMAVIALRAQDGGLIWDFTWGQGYGYEEVDGMVADGDYLYLSGWTTSKATGNDVAILKLDRNGKIVWAQSWGGNGWDEADGQMVVDEDSIYVAGRYDGTSILTGGIGLLARFSKETGECLSHTTWGGPIFTDALGLTGDGDYLYAVGLTLDKGNGGQIFLRKYDKDLRLLWEQVWGGKGSEHARAAAVGNSGDIFVAGASDSYGNGRGLDFVLLRYTPEGSLVYSKTWGGKRNDVPAGIVLFGGSVYIPGRTESIGNGQDDAILVKAGAETGEFPPM